MPIKFITPPPAQNKRIIGDEKTGTFEVVVRGGLTTEESDIMSSITADEEDSAVMDAKLAEEIAEAEGISKIEASSIMDRYFAKTEITGDEEVVKKERAIKEKYEDKLQKRKYARRKASSLSTKAAVTAMMICRVEGCEDWTLANVKTMDAVHYIQMVRLFYEEQENYIPSQSPMSEEELGKPPEAQESEQKPTGQKSTTNSPTPSQATSSVKRST